VSGQQQPAPRQDAAAQPVASTPAGAPVDAKSLLQQLAIPENAAQPVGADHQPTPAPQAPQAAQQPLTKEQLKAIEQAREEERKAAEKLAREDALQRRAMEAAAQQRAEQDRKDEKRRAQAAKLELERQKRESDVAKKNAEQARRQNEEEQKRQKALTDAALKLKQAQDAYQAEVAKTSTNKGGTK
jgi:hypothetical protein